MPTSDRPVSRPSELALALFAASLDFIASWHSERVAIYGRRLVSCRSLNAVGHMDSDLAIGQLLYICFDDIIWLRIYFEKSPIMVRMANGHLRMIPNVIVSSVSFSPKLRR